MMAILIILLAAVFGINCEDSDEHAYLESQDKLSSIKLEIVDGEKSGSRWLIIDDIYIMHKKQETKNDIFWECAGRRHFGC